MSSIPLLFRSCSMKTSLANDFAVVRLETKEGPFYYRNISGEEFIFYYSFKLIPKTRRRGKLQSLQFYINSKTDRPVTRQNCNYLAEMVITRKRRSSECRLFGAQARTKRSTKNKFYIATTKAEELPCLSSPAVHHDHPPAHFVALQSPPAINQLLATLPFPCLAIPQIIVHQPPKKHN